MVAYLGGAFLVLAWLGSGQKKRRARAADGSRRSSSDDDGPIIDDMGEIGSAGGYLGGELEDLMVGRFALRRAKIAQRERNKKRKS